MHSLLPSWKYYIGGRVVEKNISCVLYFLMADIDDYETLLFDLRIKWIQIKKKIKFYLDEKRQSIYFCFKCNKKEIILRKCLAEFCDKHLPTIKKICR